MTNIHTVTQVKPLVIRRGACILIRQGQEKACEKKLANLLPAASARLDIRRPEGQIVINNINEERTSQQFLHPHFYLVISSGSSSGYDDYFIKGLSKLAPHLEDAEFYIESEYEDEILEHYKIFRGKLKYKKIEYTEQNSEIPRADTFIDYYQKLFPKEKEILFQLLKQEIIEDCKYFDVFGGDWYETFKTRVNTALSIHSKDLEILSSHANALSALGRYKESIKINKFLLRRLEKDPLRSPLFRRTLYANIATGYCALKKFTFALQYAQKGKVLIPTYGDYRVEEKQVYAYNCLGRFQEAIDLCDEIIARSLRKEDIAYAFLNKACALIELERYEEAAASLSAAYTLAPYNLPSKVKQNKDVLNLFLKLKKHEHVKSIMGRSYDKL